MASRRFGNGRRDGPGGGARWSRKRSSGASAAVRVLARSRDGFCRRRALRGISVPSTGASDTERVGGTAAVWSGAVTAPRRFGNGRRDGPGGGAGWSRKRSGGASAAVGVLARSRDGFCRRRALRGISVPSTGASDTERVGGTAAVWSGAVTASRRFGRSEAERLRGCRPREDGSRHGAGAPPAGEPACFPCESQAPNQAAERRRLRRAAAATRAEAAASRAREAAAASGQSKVTATSS